jgi:hypothetical protein
MFAALLLSSGALSDRVGAKRAPAAGLKELTNGLGAHSVIEAVGTQEAMLQAIGSARAGGHVGFDTVSCPPDEDHWHGATADTFMSHLAMLEALPAGPTPPPGSNPCPTSTIGGRTSSSPPRGRPGSGSGAVREPRWATPPRALPSAACPRGTAPRPSRCAAAASPGSSRR